MSIVVEISGIGFPNKGAELMLAEVSHRLRNAFGDEVISVCRPNQSGSESAGIMAKLGVLPLAELSFKGHEIGGLLNYAPERLLAPFGVRRRKDVNIVLDASGLKFSEDWGLQAIERGEQYLAMKAASGVKVVLLPQAFGPFNSSAAKSSMKRVLNLADLVYARDHKSYSYLRELSASERIKLCPDLTIGCNCSSFSPDESVRDAVIIIPNQRMLDKGDVENRAMYKDFLLALGRQLVEDGQPLVLLNHEGKTDRQICDWLHGELGLSSDILEFSDARELKATISVAKSVVTSRFHGAVSALSEAVPCFATSWSHKYKMLFMDFEVTECLIDMGSSQEVGRLSGLLKDMGHLAALRRRLAASKLEQSEQVEQMWDDVYRIFSV